MLEPLPNAVETGLNREEREEERRRRKIFSFSSLLRVLRAFAVQIPLLSHQDCG